MIASEENQVYLAHYGVKGMRWRQRKAFRKTQELRGGMRAGAQMGKEGADEAERTETERKMNELRESIIKKAKENKDKIKERNKRTVDTAKKIKDAIDNHNKGIINGVRGKAEASAAPRKTVRMIGGIFSGGVTAANGAVEAKNYKREWGKSKTVGGPKKKSTSSRKK